MDEDKTKEQLIEELLKLRQRTAELEKSEIRHKRVEDAMRKKTQELSALYNVAKTVSQSLDLNEILSSALEIILHVMRADSGGVNLIEDAKLHLKVHRGISQKFVETVKTVKVGVGVSGRAAELKKPVAIDASQYPILNFIPILQDEGIKSLASTPIIFKNKVLGTVNIYYRRFHTFSQDELDILAFIGSQTGIAIENARLFSELERHDKTIEALYSIESVVSRSLNLEEIFNVALSKALEVTETEAGTLYSLDGDVLRLEAVVGLPPEFKEKAAILKMGEGISGIAAQSKKPITMDISQYPSPLLLPYVTEEGLVSFIGAPLMSKGIVVGALALGTKKKRIFTQDDLDLLFSIGNVIGIAIENARLYKESTGNVQKLQKAYEELQILDRMKDEFISNVSHELKTPLVSIKGYGELLYDEKLVERLDEQKKCLEAIIRNANRLTRLINSILLVSRLQAGKIEFRFEPLDLDKTVQTCVRDFKSIMDKKHIIFEKNIPEISRIEGDKDKFVEVINNLLDNAIKFTPEGGKISIKAWDEAQNVHIIVSDNGIGIPADIIPKLFARFYQVDASTARKYGGTGIGLYITKNIIDAFRGKIWIESEVGKGTMVHILLPVAREGG
jgi:signal transduction histidine kinase